MLATIGSLQGNESKDGNEYTIDNLRIREMKLTC